MKHKKTFLTSIFLGLGLELGLNSVAFADKKLLKIDLPQKAGQEREDYQECLAAVIKKYKGSKGDKQDKKRQLAIAGCRDRYPAASILAECKKQMTEGYKDQPDTLKAALKSCQEEYKKYAFDAKSAIPLAIKGDKAFFAGVGMNEPTLMKEDEDDENVSAQYMSENFGNFSCSPLYGAMFDEDPPEHTLFGTNPLLWNPMKNLSQENFAKAVKYTANKPKSFLSKDFGELVYDAKSASFLSYLPSSYCFFNRKIGNIFEALKIYYLLDVESRTVLPYFGVGFYKDKTAVAPKELADQYQARMGDAYKVTELKPGVFIVSTQSQFEVDAEGDPKNLCQKNSISPYVALVVTRDSSKMAAYSLFSNTANLCRFGDRLASRFLKKKPL